MTQTQERVEKGDHAAPKTENQSNASNEAWDTMRAESRQNAALRGTENKTDSLPGVLEFGSPFPQEGGKHNIVGDDKCPIDKEDLEKERQDGREPKVQDSFLWGNHGDNPLASIKPEAIHQGQLGDCYFLAPLASMAKSNPEAVKNMIKDNGNDTYTVTFPGDPEHPVTVDKPTDEELAKYAHDDGVNGAWVNVIEKAHRQYTGRMTEDKGDDPEKAIKLLTGKDTVDDDLSGTILRIGRTTEENVAKDLTNAMKDGRIITASTQSENWLRNHLGASNDPGDLTSTHAFAVVGYDEKSKTVTLQNPWGKGEGKEGSFTMSLDEFYNNFTDMDFAKA